MGLRGFSALAWLVFLAPFAWPSSAVAQQQAGSCVACHLNIGDDRLAKPAQDFSQDIHSAKGFSCISCHGGDATQAGMGAMDPAKGYIGKPEGRQIPQICGRCHSDARFMKRYNPALRVDQVTEYYFSGHGRRLMLMGDPNVATCVKCHSSHSIKPPSDPESSVHPLRVAETCGSCHADAKHMAPYKIPTDQVVKYKKSVHWKTMSVKGDLSAPTCNDCHGNHGAAPPGISWVGNVCGQCHVTNEELFNKSFHAKVFIQLGNPGCVTCHGNHEITETSDEMLGLGEKAVCAGCHSRDDKGGKIAVAMRESIDSLSGEYDKAYTLLSRAEHSGMEVSQAQFELSGARTALVKARAAVHAFNAGDVKKETETGLGISAKAYTLGIRVLDEIQFRRKGLAVSVVIILALIVGLVLKIRQMERGK
jgi:predicted CXXCH cytochrome family protein